MTDSSRAIGYPLKPKYIIQGVLILSARLPNVNVYFGIAIDDGGLEFTDNAIKEICKTYKICAENQIELVVLIKNELNNHIQSSVSNNNHLDHSNLAVIRYSDQDCWIFQNKVHMELSSVLSNSIFVPRLALKVYNINAIRRDIAGFEKKSAFLWAECVKKYDDIIRKNFSVPNGLIDLFEPLTGAVIFRDYEWEEIECKNRLKHLFSAEYASGAKKNILLLDFHIMLRGVDIYYYYSSFTHWENHTTESEYNQWVLNVKIFLSNAADALQAYEMKTQYDSRLLLALVDNLRNIAIIMMNIMSFTLVDKNNFIASITDPNLTEVNYWTAIMDDVIESILSICLQNPMMPEHILRVNSIVNRMNSQIDISLRHVWPYKEYLSFYKSFNPLREIDNFFENYITLEYAVNALNSNGLSSRRVMLVSILSGSIEMPFIIRKLGLKSKSLDIFVSFQNNGLYLDKQKKAVNSYDDNIIRTVAVEHDAYCVVVDDNILSAVTMQLTINQLAVVGINVDKAICIRHPNINRLAQSNHYMTVVNPDLLDKFILGALCDTRYTKVHEGVNYGEMFTDALGIGSLSAELFLKAIYKNGAFIKDSEADIFVGYLEPQKQFVS